MNHKLDVAFDASSENESLARMVISAFMTGMNPTIDEIDDVKTAVSEAVTNAIIHGYEGDESCIVRMHCESRERLLIVEIMDEGVGIENVEEAMEPFFTTKAHQERSGMGFAFMEAFMDEVQVKSEPGKGTRVILKKCIGATLV